MQSVNLIVHIVSGLVVLYLVWTVLRQQRLLHLQRKLWDSVSVGNNLVQLSWVASIFTGLSEVWGIRIKGSFSESQPLRVDLKTWVLCHVTLGIVEIEGLPEQVLRVGVRRQEAADEWVLRLEEAVSHKFRIQIKLCSAQTS